MGRCRSHADRASSCWIYLAYTRRSVHSIDTWKQHMLPGKKWEEVKLRRFFLQNSHYTWTKMLPWDGFWKQNVQKCVVGREKEGRKGAGEGKVVDATWGKVASWRRGGWTPLYTRSYTQHMHETYRRSATPSSRLSEVIFKLYFSPRLPRYVTHLTQRFKHCTATAVVKKTAREQ